MWHALEREWKFVGFAHKAKELFEKSATKYMRNRKMQLKIKSRKLKSGSKSDDVTPSHWKEIVAITNKPVKQEERSASTKADAKGKRIMSADVVSIPSSSTQLEEKEDGRFQKIPEFHTVPFNFVASKEEDVNTQIENLRSQLQWLESCRKAKELSSNELTDVLQFDPREVSQVMKENVTPLLRSCRPPSRSSGTFVEVCWSFVKLCHKSIVKAYQKLSKVQRESEDREQ